MDVLIITILVCLVLSGLFLLGFLYHSRNPDSSPEHDSLMPLKDEDDVLGGDGDDEPETMKEEKEAENNEGRDEGSGEQPKTSLES